MTGPVEVRRLTAADAPLMHAIIAMLPPGEWRGEDLPSLDYLRRALGDERIYVFAALDGERPAGFVSAYRFPALTEAHDLVYVYDVFVAESDRGKGAGRRMMDALIAQLRADGVAEAWVGTDLDNEAARRLYLSAGAVSGEQYVQFEYVFAPKAGAH
jgi:ribosomal protein S18 acetylase RimI-like enzyme